MMAVTLACAMLIGAVGLTGCGKSADEGSKAGEEVTIKYTTYSAGPDHIQDLESMIAEFEKQNEGIKVDYEVIGYSDYFTKLQTQAASKTLPDVFEINYENFINYAQNGVLLDMSTLAGDDEDFKPEMLSGNSIEYFKYDEKLYGLTEKFSDVVMYYNKDLFDQAGVEYPQADWTWKEELEAAQALTKDGVYGSYSPVQYYELYKTVAQNGGALFDEKGNPTIDSKENTEAVQWMMDKMYLYNIQPTPEQMSGKSPEDMFKNSEIAMIRTGSWMLSTFADAGFNWDIALEPGNTKKVHHVFVDGMAASKTTKNPEAAWKFIKFMSVDPAATKIRLESNWDLPVANDATVKEKFIAQGKPESREVIFEALDTGIMPPVVKNNSQVQDAVNEELNKALIGQATVEEALSAAQEKVAKIIK